MLVPTLNLFVPFFVLQFSYLNDYCSDSFLYFSELAGVLTSKVVCVRILLIKLMY